MKIMTDANAQLSIMESRILAQRRKRGNILLMLVLFGFTATMFFVSYSHLQLETQTGSPVSRAVTDK
ncbi:MAG: hypothetical protein CML31_17320 [Rhizobiales bacterium]|jgi:hypothetical protein|nr:hypothetical protein [Hyphomicrobiales bacterium]|tara:strand:- start:1399 stop:1599 length:201 start_codon:yes stop_codon:yes gene_type:complete